MIERYVKKRKGIDGGTLQYEKEEMRKKRGTRGSCIKSGVGAKFTWTELTALTSLYLLDCRLVIDLHRNGFGGGIVRVFVGELWFLMMDVDGGMDG